MPRKKFDTLPEPEPEPEPVKTKKPVSQERKQHLDSIRPKALEAKRELKEITMKAKLAKNMEKIELAKKYDEHVKSKIQTQTPSTPDILAAGAARQRQLENAGAFLNAVDMKPQKPKRIVKKIIEVESSEESEVEEQVVYVKKNKPKQQQQHQQQESLNHLLYQSTQERLQARVMEERLKARVAGYNSFAPTMLGKF